MKLLFVFSVLLIATACTNATTTDQDNSLFVEIFKNLHREPPPPPVKSRAGYHTKWIDQKVDNFNSSDQRTWQMRYMLNDEFFVDGAPLFIFVGGEWTISSGLILGGHMYDMAKEHNGLLAYTEHRYYGYSRPTENMSLENLKYLNVRQALADLANFIRSIKATTTGLSKSKVILVGGSYSATMVIWFKKLYPDLAVGCWASSGPILAKVDFVEYREVTGQSIALVGGNTCYSRIRNGIAELEDMFDNNRVAEAKAMLKLCNSFDEIDNLNVWTLFNGIANVFAAFVQGHEDGYIQWLCDTVMEGRTDVVGVVKLLLLLANTQTCNDVSYNVLINLFMDSSYNSNDGLRQWIYQTCNEFGWFQTSGSQNQPFGTKFPLTLYTTLCQDIYGDKYTNEFIQNQVDETNAYFGGLLPQVENVYMTHGSLDPWRPMGIQDEAQATILNGYAHCKDLYSISDSDTAQMRASKERIAQLVREWVAA